MFGHFFIAFHRIHLPHHVVAKPQMVDNIVKPLKPRADFVVKVHTGTSFLLDILMIYYIIPLFKIQENVWIFKPKNIKIKHCFLLQNS
jgi:ABC-type amino acid transport system permease subunit